MARFTMVEFWPATGSFDRPWLDDPGQDAFAKTATRVCERFSEALRDAPDGGQINSRVGSLRLFTHHHEDRRAAEPAAGTGSVLVEVSLDPPYGYESSGVFLPDGIEHLAAQDRAHLVLEVICGAAGRLAEARGWDGQVLAAARQHVIDNDYCYAVVGPWKANRSRSHRARCVLDLADDGFGRLTLEVAEAGSEQVALSAGPFVSFSTREGFMRSLRTLRWTSARTVTVVPLINPFGHGSDAVVLDLDSDGTTPADAAPAPATTATSSSASQQPPRVPPVVVRGVGAAAPEQPHEIRVGGGGPTNNASKVYRRTLSLMLHQLESEPWQEWWCHAPVAVLTIFYWFDAGRRPGVRVERRENEATASIARAAHSQGLGAEGIQQAHADVTALVDRLRSRFNLPDPPQLRLLEPPGGASQPDRSSR